MPEGWANSNDWQALDQLVPADAFQRLAQQPDVWPSQITTYARPVALDPTSICTNKADPTRGRTAADLVDFVLTHPGLSVTSQGPVTIGGHAGTRLDVDIAQDWTGTCPEWTDSGPFVPLFGDGDSAAADGTVSDGYWFGVGWGTPCERSDPIRLIILDLGDGDVSVILIDAEIAADQAKFVEQAMPIVETFAFAD